MSVCAVLIGLLMGCANADPPPARPLAATQEAERVDRWLAEDKLRHFTTSFAATTIAYAGARTTIDPGPARAVAGGVALSLGVGKEVVDARSGRWFSFKDLVWDAAGVALGILLVDQIR